MSSVDMTLVEQARAIEHPLPVPGVSGVYGLEAGDQSYQVTEAQLAQIRTRFTAELRHGLGKVEATVAGGMYGHADMAQLREDQFLVSRISEMMPSGKALLAGLLIPGGAAYLAYDIDRVKRERAFPDQLIWVAPSEMLGRGRKDVKAGHLSDAAADLGSAEASAAKAMAALSKYREGVIEGAGSAADALEVTRDVSFATVGIIATVVTGGSVLAAAGIGTATTTAGAVAQQAMEVHLDMRKEIDWGGITFDAVIGFVTTLIGAKLSGAATNRLLGNTAVKQAAATLGRKAFALIVNDVVIGSAMGAAQGVAKEVFEEARGKKQTLSMEQYWALVLKQLLDPKTAFWNLLQGEVTRRLHMAMPAKPGGGHGGSPPQLEQKAPPQLEQKAPQLEQHTTAQLEQMQAPSTEQTQSLAAEQTQSLSTEQTQSMSIEPAASSEPAPQFIDPVAQAQSVERPEFAGLGAVSESSHPGPSNMELAEPRTAADHPQEHVPDLGGESSGLELDPGDRPQGFGAEPQPGLELEHASESGLELDTDDHAQGLGVEPEQRMLEPDYGDGSGFELGPSEHAEGFGAEVDARIQEPQHTGTSGLEPLDLSKKKNQIYTPPDKTKAAARRLAAWREYNKKRKELQQRNPDFAPGRPDSEGYEELTKPMKVPGVDATEHTFGTKPGELTGTHERQGVFFNELNAAEIQGELRIEVDTGTGRVQKVRYRIDGNTVPKGKPVIDRSFKADESLPVAQSSDDAYKKANAARRAQGQKPLNRGHLAQREAFKTPADRQQLAERGVEGQSIGRLDAFRSTPEALAAADQWTNVVPMTEELNQGKDWRDAENRSLDLADQHGHVYVEIVPDYGTAPKTLSDGTPIPEGFQRVVIGPDGTILESNPYLNQ